MLRIPSQVRYASVAALAIFVGAGLSSPAAAASTRHDLANQIGSVFYFPLVKSVPSTPCNSQTENGKTTTRCTAVVDSRGQLAVSDADTHASLGRFRFDSSGNLQTSGSLNVANFPANQQVNFGGAAQPVTVQNFPTPPAANKGADFSASSQGPKTTYYFNAGLNVSFLHMESRDDTTTYFELGSGAVFSVLKLNGETREISFPQPVNVRTIRVACNTLFTKCTYFGTVLGS